MNNLGLIFSERFWCGGVITLSGAKQILLTKHNKQYKIWLGKAPIKDIHANCSWLFKGLESFRAKNISLFYHVYFYYGQFIVLIDDSRGIELLKLCKLVVDDSCPQKSMTTKVGFIIPYPSFTNYISDREYAEYALRGLFTKQH